MAKHRRGTEGQGKQGKSTVKKNEAGIPEAQGDADDCRCKEISKKTPRELLKVMIGDLSFWKKKK
jgi:hypothetical protein